MIVDLLVNGHNVYYGGIGDFGETFVGKKIIEIKKAKKCVMFICACTTVVSCSLCKECPNVTCLSRYRTVTRNEGTLAKVYPKQKKNV